MSPKMVKIISRVIILVLVAAMLIGVIAPMFV